MINLLPSGEISRQYRSKILYVNKLRKKNDDKQKIEISSKKSLKRELERERERERKGGRKRERENL